MYLKIKNDVNRLQLEEIGFTVSSNIENDLTLKKFLDQGKSRSEVEVFYSIIYYVNDDTYVDGKKPLLIIDPKDMIIHFPQDTSEYEEVISEVLYKLFTRNYIEARDTVADNSSFMGLKTSTIVDSTKSIEEIYEKYKAGLEYFKKNISLDVFCPPIYMSSIAPEKLDIIEATTINFESIKSDDQHRIFLVMSAKRDAMKIYDKEVLYASVLKNITNRKYTEVGDGLYEMSVNSVKILFQYLTINY